MESTNLLSATAGVMKYIPRTITVKVISGIQGTSDGIYFFKSRGGQTFTGWVLNFEGDNRVIGNRWVNVGLRGQV